MPNTLVRADEDGPLFHFPTGYKAYADYMTVSPRELENLNMTDPGK
jgi:hypothetical protein